jgi:hypothetical protein
MAIPDFARHVTAQSFAAGERAYNLSFSKQAQAAPQGPAKASAADGFSFDDLIDIVNPLQHIPVVSTIYRAITDDTEKPVAEIAGGALYGGLIGLGGSLLDVAFKEITGKDFGDTVLSWIGGGDSSDAKLAEAKSAPAPAPPKPVQAPAPGSAALMAAADAKGLEPDLRQRALFAYRRSIGMNAAVPVLSE